MVVKIVGQGGQNKTQIKPQRLNVINKKREIFTKSSLLTKRKLISNYVLSLSTNLLATIKQQYHLRCTKDNKFRFKWDNLSKTGMSTNICILKNSNILVPNNYSYSYSFHFKLTNIFKYSLKATYIFEYILCFVEKEHSLISNK